MKKLFYKIKTTLASKVSRILLVITVLGAMAGAILPATGVLASTITMGNSPTDTGTYTSANQTQLTLDNSAGYTGTITTVKVFVHTNLTGVVIGAFYFVSGTTYECRDSVSVGSMSGAGSVVTVSGLSLAVNSGDYVGIYATGGQYAYIGSAHAGVEYNTGECMTASTQYSMTNESGDGLEIQFLGETIPTVTTQAATNITTTTATGNGNLTDNTGQDGVSAEGICYSHTDNPPTTADSKVETDGSNLSEGAFTESLTGLSASTLYYTRAYAINPAGTAYGSTQSFTTSGPSDPTVVTANSAVSGVTVSGATCNESVSSTGGATVTAWGTYYGFTTGYGSTAPNTGSQTNSFSWGDALTGLNSATLYHYQAYATNSNGTGTGSDATLLTLPSAPSSPNATTGTSQQVGLSWTAATGDGTATITSQVQYSTSSYPTTYSSGTTGISWTASTSGNVTGLTNSQLYYFSIFSKAVEGGITEYSTAYAQITATPQVASSPTVVTANTAPTSTISGFTANESVSNYGGATNTAWGTYYGTTTGYGSPGSPASNTGTQTGNFNWPDTITGLTSGTLYHYEAYSTNSSGTGTGSDAKVLTLPSAPSNVSPTPASGQVSFTWTPASGGAGTTIETQIQWSTSGYPTAYNNGTTGVAWTTNSTATITGLSNNVFYYFSIFSEVTYAGVTTQYSTVYATTTATPNSAGGSTVKIPPTQSVQFENMTTTGTGNGTAIYGNTAEAEIFQTGSTAHQVTSVYVKLERVGSPGSVCTVSINTVSSGIPTNEVLTSGTFNANNISTSYSYIQVSVTSYGLLPTTQYAIVITMGGTGDASNYIYWSQLVAGDGNGNTYALHTADATQGWTSDTPADDLFQIWGWNDLQVVSANIYPNYITTGDWLITAEVIDNYPQMVYSANITANFALELLNGSTIVASTPLVSWGDAPECIYLSPSEATSLTFGSPYTVVVTGTFAGKPNGAYTLQTSDWKSASLNDLNNWCISVAGDMNTYYGNTSTDPYTTQLTGQIIQLTADGGASFALAIPSIQTQDPQLFTTGKTSPNLAFGGSANNVYDTLQNETAQVGTEIANDASIFGNILGVSGQQFLGFIFYAIIALLTAYTVFNAQGMETPFALTLCVPVLLYANYLRVIPAYVTVVFGAICLFLWVRKFWVATT